MCEKKCSNCAYADFRFNNAPVGTGRHTFWCGHKQEWPTYSTKACNDWEDRYKEPQDEVR